MNQVLIGRQLTYEYSQIGERRIGVFDIDISLKKGQALGLVGESGSGKSTIAKLICRFLKPDQGELTLLGKPVSAYKDRDYYARVQYIAQQPQSTFHPKRSIQQSLEEVCRNFSLYQQPSDRKQAIHDLLRSVGLTPELAQRLPHQLSGGECQRAAIARALLINPDVLICDEITSALDVTVQYEVMQLLADIKERSQTSFLFISHDIALVSNFAEDLVVLKDGIVQEKGSMREVVSAPKSDYTKLLLSQYREDENDD